MSVVEDLQDVLAGLSRKKKNKALTEEYQNAIAVLEDRVKITSGRFPNILSDLRMVIQFEKSSDNPDADKIKESQMQSQN